MIRPSWWALACLVVASVLAFAGCGKNNGGTLTSNLRPEVTISAPAIEGDTTFYSVRINWFASDQDGQVVRYIYAVDPPVMGDTAWVTQNASEVSLFFNSNKPPVPLPSLGSIIISRGYHTFVLKAIDNEGAASPYQTLSFTSRTTAPSTTISLPRPNDQAAVSTTPSVTVTWTGTDPDGVISQKPVKYKFKLAPASDIDPNNPEGVTKQQIQDYFGKDADNLFAQWDSVGGDTTFKFYEGLSPNTKYYFAIVAFDEAGAFEPRFSLTTNVLQFRPTLDKLGPRMTVFNEFYAREQRTGGVSLAPSRIYPLEIPSDTQVRFNWTATPATGAVITGYRWALDIENQDVTNETAREDENDLKHWSTWSLNETSALLPKFVGSLDSSIVHYFYVEARDNLGFISLFTLRLSVVKARLDRDLWVIDDIYGTLSEKPFRYKDPYPMECEADSFFYSVGGFADSAKIKAGTPGAISEPGCFAGFDYDTLDYGAKDSLGFKYPFEGVQLSDLSRYKVVVWYSDHSSAARTGGRFASNQPSCALRVINSIGRLNSLAVYMRQGGKLWLMGDGTTVAIANGYWSRIVGGFAPPALPYTSGDEARQNVLFQGNFLYDFCHLRSEIDFMSDGTSFEDKQRMLSAIPYLPEFAGPASATDRTHDPRIGPSSARTAENWSGLPRLVVTYRGTSRPVAKTMIVTKPLFITEGSGNDFTATLDTLYLGQASLYDPNRTQVPPTDAFPNALSYHGSDNGPVVWFGFHLYWFPLADARTVTQLVLKNLGLTPAPPGQPSGAHPWVPSAALSTQPQPGSEELMARRTSR